MLLLDRQTAQNDTVHSSTMGKTGRILSQKHGDNTGM
jgi:hypothetical protein